MANNNLTQAQNTAIASVEDLKGTIYIANTYNSDVVVLIGPRNKKSKKRLNF